MNSAIMKINTYPNPWDIEYFQEIANTLNLSRASERLGIGQPALSLSLKRLEDNLGVKLFYRRNKGLSLTPAGLRLLKESNALLSNWQSLVAETKKSETELMGRYSLGAHPSVALYALQNVVKDIYSEYPSIELQLVHALSREITEKVISGEVDFGIVVNPFRHPDLVIHKIALDEVCFWKKKNSLPDVLICNPNLTQTQSLLNKIKEKGIFSRTITSDSLEVIASLIASGAGVGILPSRVANVFSSSLEKISHLPSFQDEIVFIHRSDMIKTQSAKVLIDKFKKLKI